MTRILYLSNTGTVIGGCENRLIGLVNNLNKNLYAPIIVCPEEGEYTTRLRNAGIQVYVCPMPMWRKGRSYFSRRPSAIHLAKLAKEHKIDLIHTSNLWTNYYAWQVGKSLGIPIISHVRDILKSERIHKYLFHKFDKVIAISERTKKPLVKGGIPSKMVDVIYNGIDLSKFGLDNVNGDILYQSYPLKKYAVGLIGRIEPFKRQLEFIHVIAKVLQIRQDVSFLIIGDPAEGQSNYFSEVQNTVEKYNIADHIIFTGYRNDMPQVLKSLDIVVTLSAGGVVMEAMASHLPVVGTDLGSASEMIDDGVTGFLLPQNDANAVSDAIIRLLENEKMRHDMGTAGRKRAEKILDVSKNIRLVEAVYENVLRKAANESDGNEC